MKKVINLLLITIILLAITAVTVAHADGGTAFSVSGQVVDRYGNPLSGADVTLIDNNYMTISSKKTLDDGAFDFVNVVASTGTCTVEVSYTDSDGTVHNMPQYYVRWYPTKGIQLIPSSETMIPDYPLPSFGYVWGAIGTSAGTGGNFINGIVYLSSLDSGVTYYLFADRTDGKGSYYFYVPPGPYTLYAQHWENGVVYESTPKQVTVGRNTDPTDPGLLPTQIILPLNTPATDPNPQVMPVPNENLVNGTVMTKDGKPWPGATVTLLEQSDNATMFIPMLDANKKPITAVTDANGNYQFYAVSPTTDDGKSIQTKKDIKVMVAYTDNNGTQQTITADTRDARPLYYPDVIMGYGAENAARNVSLPSVVLPFAKGGWVSLTSAPSGANIYVDDQELFGPDGNPLLTPCTAYIDPGTHTIKMTKNGFSDSTDTITMVANTEHSEFTLSLPPTIVPQWVTLVVAVIILLIVVILLFALLATRIKFLLTPIGLFMGGLRHKASDAKANRDISNSHKAEAAEHRRMEQQRRSDDKIAQRRDSIRGESRDRPAVAARDEPVHRDDVHVVNVDPVKRKHEAPKVFEEGKKVFEGSKKIFDLKHITESVPRKIKPRETIDPQKDKSSMVFASDIYKKTNTDVERIPYESSQKQTYSDRESLTERQPPVVQERRQTPAVSERNDRIRVPKTSQQREPTSVGDKERVLRYIRDHAEGVSFIQMSNDLEIIPNNLTYITKELVINDDIEKVKGLYYYKSHTSSAEDSTSSVVVWRLDGDK